MATLFLPMCALLARSVLLLYHVPRCCKGLSIHGHAKDALAAREAQNLLRGIDQTGEHHTTAEEAFASFIFDSVSKKVAETQVHAMADRFEEMVVFDELIDKNTALSS
ncbi:uncharacterized protein BKA55DRAFT_694497 [Fusarium redolens]|uniref:Uncharacterized protein n=1 Tax=Fusarium redolens TaxID=48865 RepID=A0A9P9GF65_FUSRE|nr:uncharacterized protein BKA55DRAFT_694497 [Fusarium redolens]KAH7236874.1 hypothetical protein BKA55DRAFT_694497 [Fusarium redolens]